MNTPSMIALLISILLLLVAAFFSVLTVQNQRKLMNRVNHMLDAAIDGTFSESAYDESLLSAVETRMAHYLCASEVSAKNLTEEKEKIKALIADISHQTKTPIANILLYAQLLREQGLPEGSEACVEALNGQAEKLATLVEALVKASRLEAGVFVLRPKTQAIQPMFDRVVEQIAPKVAANNIRLTVEETSACANFDLKWTTEALYNILDNGVKYSHRGGTLHLCAKQNELFARIDVIDHGIGIPEEEQANIFRRFYRSPAVSDTEGVGIGLYLARKIVSGQGGYLKVRSNLNEGSTFSIFLPTEK